jgi:tryptophan synthase alpha chain
MTARPTITGNRIDALFARCRAEKRAALILYITSGFPNLRTTERLLPVLVEAGCDLIELGVPFSDPIADGPVIQKASTIALEAGTTLPATLDLLRGLRRTSQVPVVLFGAVNPFIVRGLTATADMAREAGADGILAADVPLEESAELRAVLAERQMHLITLVAPTTPPARIRAISNASSGFLYCISYKGVTGRQAGGQHGGGLCADIGEYLARIRRESDLPLALGFGIRTPADVRDAVDAGADGVVVGTSLINVIEAAHSAGRDVVAEVRAYVSSLAAELRRRP